MISPSPNNFNINRRRLVFATAVAWILFRLTVITVRGVNIGLEAVSPVTAVELSVIVALIIWLKRGGRPETVATVLLLLLTIPLFIFTYMSGGLQGPVVTVGLCFPIMAFLLIGKQGGWITCSLLLAFYTGTAYLNAYSDFFPNNRLSTQGLFVAKALSLSLVSILLSWIGWYYAKLHERQVNHLQKKNAELERLAQYRQDFLANMSHEFRTPLNSIIGFTRRVIKTKSSELDDRSIDALNTVIRTGVSLNDLVNQILDISKLESGQVKLNTQRIELYPWLQEQCRLHKVAADEKALILTIEQPPCNLIVMTDVTKLSSLLRNLISNAIKYTETGIITISISKPDEKHFNIDVQDTGAGIPEEKLAILFDKFSRLDTHEKSTIVGTGLGLAIAKEISKLLGGNVSVNSVIGEGSCFSITLPIDAAINTS